MKGTSQVDWAISVGIFLIYTIGLIIFLRPGLQPAMENNILISIIQNSLKEEVYAIVQKTPLFINTSSQTIPDFTPPDTGNYQIEINDPLLFEGNKDDFALLDKNNNFLNFRLTDEKKLRFDGFVEKDELNLFWLLYYKDHNYQNNNPSLPGGKYAIKNNENFTYGYGVAEGTVGIDYKNLIGIEQDINILKNRWNFPESKDFSIILANTTKKQYTQNDVIFSYNMKESLDQSDVFVKEWRDWIISNKGELYGITLNLRVGDFE